MLIRALGQALHAAIQAAQTRVVDLTPSQLCLLLSRNSSGSKHPAPQERATIPIPRRDDLSLVYSYYAPHAGWSLRPSDDLESVLTPSTKRLNEAWVQAAQYMENE
jgi:hypothetical protein